MSYEDPQSNSLCKPYFLKVSVVLTCHVFFYLSCVCHGSKQGLHPDFRVMARTPLGLSFKDEKVVEKCSSFHITCGDFVYELKQHILK